MIVPLRCGQVVGLLTCWVKKANLFFRWEIYKEMFATHTARDFLGKETVSIL
jgi:hypothetical protein